MEKIPTPKSQESVPPQDFEEAPEGWLTEGLIAKELKRSPGLISKKVEEYRADHPEWFKIYKFQRPGPPAEFLSPELTGKLRQELGEYETPPEGWVSLSELVESLQRDRSVVERISEQYRVDHPEWFGIYLGKRNKRTLFYSPDLIKKIQEEESKFGNPPEDWTTSTTIGKELNREFDTIRRIAEPFRANHPEWFKFFRGSSGVFEYYSPALTEKIKKEDSKYDDPPEGWLVYNEIAELSKISRPTAIKIARELIARDENKNLYKKCRDPESGQLIDYYSPEIVPRIIEFLKVQESPEQGWETSSQLAGRLESTQPFVKKLAEKFREEYPNCFKNFRIQQGVYEYYSPELVNKIEEEIKIYELPLPGWTNLQDLTKTLDRSRQYLKDRAGELGKDHPDWIKWFKKKGKPGIYLSPELSDLLLQKESEVEPLPEGWVTIRELATKTQRDYSTILEKITKHRQSHPEWFRFFKSHGTGRAPEYLSPELVTIIRAFFKEKDYDKIPEGWKNEHQISKELDVTGHWIKKIIGPLKKDHPEWFGIFKEQKKTDLEYFSPEVLAIIRKEVEKFQKWQSVGSVVKELSAEGINVSEPTIHKFANNFRAEHPNWFLSRTPDVIGQGKELYAFSLVELIKENFRQYPAPPENWKTIPELAKDLEVSGQMITNISKNYKTKPEWFKKFKSNYGIAQYFSPELSDEIRNAVRESKSVPEGSIAVEDLAQELKVSINIINRRTNVFREEHPAWFKLVYNKTGAYRMFYVKELADKVREVITSENISSESGDKERQLKKDLVEFGQVLEQGEKIEAQDFRKLIDIFGSSKVVDILYKFHPEFRGLPVQFVKSVIADYIGDYLITKKGYGESDLSLAVEYLKDEGFRAALLEVMKESCLEYYHKQKRANPNLSDQTIIQSFVDEKKVEGSQFKSNDFNQVVQSLSDYYFEVLKIKKPERFVDELKPGRKFPDINQRINMREVADKKRLLIADEMGLGKSASAIFTKESLVLKQALVIVPKNVIDTWVDYLKEETIDPETGKKKGYFKVGQNPKVLVLESPDDLEKDVSGYEYILISHEKLNTRYTQEIMKLNPDMLIVDEVHKLKRVKQGKRVKNGNEFATGIRSKNLIQIADKIQGDEKYLAILSGTPVPNKVVDVAMILKLLYPDRFTAMTNKSLVSSIIKGDLIDLKSLLVPRMQMKSLQESIEMPQHVEKIVEYELSDTEKDIYSDIQEEDEY